MTDLQRAKKMLTEENLSCVLVSGQSVYKSDLRGVAPLLKIIKDNTDVSGYSAADKVVGKGAALLFALCGVKEVHSCVLSKVAMDVFQNEGIKHSYDKLTDRITNRAGDGLCPIESAVIDIDSPKEAYDSIIAAIELMRK